MTTQTLEDMRLIDNQIAELYVARNRVIATQEMLKRSHPMPWQIDQWKERWNTAKDQLAEIDTKISELNSSYTGWTRFFHVKHLHSTAFCSSFRWNTRITFVPDLSGLTEEQAVAELGSSLCTICFKSAPVEK
jgi:hypothetical protein